MNNLTRARTRRHLMRIAAAGALNIPLIGCEPVEPRTDRRRRTAQTAKCFLRGTKISTPAGEISVDELDIGDAICTLDGTKKVKWIGRKKIRNASNDEAWNVRPIRVARFALDDKTPHRDLYMSAGHRLFLNEVLVPVMYLVNDATIAPHLAEESLEYYHLEFDTHEVIFAEGAAVESYSGSPREWFDNFAEFEGIYGAQALGIKQPYAPIMGYNGGRDELMGLLRSLVSNVIDIRDPIQVAYDTIAGRAAARVAESHLERS
jgi:hypothetical protein